MNAIVRYAAILAALAAHGRLDLDKLCSDLTREYKAAMAMDGGQPGTRQHPEIWQTRVQRPMTR